MTGRLAHWLGADGKDACGRRGKTARCYHPMALPNEPGTTKAEVKLCLRVFYYSNRSRINNDARSIEPIMKDT
jgi:hypothetical protein